ncbi:MAG: ABC transporter substrate-binding protein [Spirochaetaceae bacterium]
MRNLTVMMMVVAVLLIPTVAMASGQAEGEESETTISFVWFTDGPDKAAIEGLVADYEEENPNVNIDFSIVPYGELNQLLQTQASAGEAPDLARVTEPYRFFEFGLDIRPYVSDGFADEFLDDPMGLITGPDGEVYGFPHDMTMNGPFINVSLFEEAGVEIPEGDVPWETWFELAYEVQQETGVPYAVAADRSGHRLDGIIQSYGGSLFTEDGSELNLDAPETQEALRTFIELHERGVMPLDIWAGGSGYVGANQQFVNGQLVMYISGNWQVAQFDETIGDSFEWRAIPNGVNEQSGGMPGGKYVMAFEGSEHPEEVADLLEYLASRESVERYVSEAMFLPAREDLLDEGVDYPVRSDVMNTFLEGLGKLPSSAYTDNYHQSFGPVANVVRDRVTQAITEEISVDEAMRLMQREAEEVME